MTTSEALRWFVRCTADMVDWFTSLQWHRIMHCVCVCVCVLNVCLSCPAFALRNSMLVEYLFKPEDKRLATPEQQSGKQHNAQCTIHCFGATPLQTCSAHNACLCLSFFCLFVCLFVCVFCLIAAAIKFVNSKPADAVSKAPQSFMPVQLTIQPSKHSYTSILTVTSSRHDSSHGVCCCYFFSIFFFQQTGRCCGRV